MASEPGQKRGPFVDTYLSYLLAHASQVVAGEFHEALKEWNISVAEWRVLSSLYGRDRVGVTELAAMAILKLPRVTAIVDRLVAAELIERLSASRDRRRVYVRLTESGKFTVRPIVRAAKAHEERILANLSAPERQTIMRALDIIMRSTQSKNEDTSSSEAA